MGIIKYMWKSRTCKNVILINIVYIYFLKTGEILNRLFCLGNVRNAADLEWHNSGLCYV